MAAPLRTIKPSISTPSLDREPGEEAALAAEREIIELRFAAGEHVERTSLRKAARDIGMSAMGLRGFLQGIRPQPRTEHKLRSWFQRHSADRDALSSGDAQAAIALLVRGIDPGERQPVVEAVLRCMEEGYRDSGRSVPAWVDELRQRAESGSATAE